MQAYEGYLEKGRVFTVEPLIRAHGRRRVIITVLDEPVHEKPSTWEALDKVVSEMDEKPRLEDFPRCKLERDFINFEEV